MSQFCMFPQRCGSDGKDCCHPDCYWSSAHIMQRADLKAKATAYLRATPAATQEQEGGEA